MGQGIDGAVFIDAPADPAQPDGGVAWPSGRLGWIAVILLSAAAVASQLDRVIINLVVEPLKASLHLSDTGFATLQGVAFGLFYTFMTLPIGRLSDRYQRRVVIGLGIGLFSLFSVATGFARTYWQLFLMRTGVGVGEASLFPAGFSIISDYFPPNRLGRAISVFTMSSMIGTGLAYVGGGALIGWLGGLHGSSLAVFRGLQTWQLAFMFVGLPGLLLAPVFFLLREPARRGVAARGATLPLKVVFAEMWARRSALGFMFAGFSMVTLVSYSLTIWTPALFIRVHHWSPRQIGLGFGLLFLVFATSGSVFAGWLSDRLCARGMLDAPLKVAAFGFVGCSLTGGLAPLAPSPWVALALLAPTVFMNSMPYPCAATALQLILPNQLRSQASALYLTFITLIGLGCGPALVGLFTDHLFTRPADVRYSLAIVVAAAGPIMLALTLLSCGPYRRLRHQRLNDIGVQTL